VRELSDPLLRRTRTPAAKLKSRGICRLALFAEFSFLGFSKPQTGTSMSMGSPEPIKTPDKPETRHGERGPVAPFTGK